MEKHPGAGFRVSWRIVPVLKYSVIDSSNVLERPGSDTGKDGVQLEVGFRLGWGLGLGVGEGCCGLGKSEG